MKFLVSLDRDEDEALENVRDAIRACLEVRVERGMPLTVETHEVEVVA
jgi:predicted RNase H-like HicB family nuclease